MKNNYRILNNKFNKLNLLYTYIYANICKLSTANNMALIRSVITAR